MSRRARNPSADRICIFWIIRYGFVKARDHFVVWRHARENFDVKKSKKIKSHITKKLIRQLESGISKFESTIGYSINRKYKNGRM